MSQSETANTPPQIYGESLVQRLLRAQLQIAAAQMRWLQLVFPSAEEMRERERLGANLPPRGR